jgi:prepilin peptidase CpaA
VPALAAHESLVTTAAFVVLMVLAGLLDLTSRRIPNALTVTAVAVGLVLRVPLGYLAVADGLLGAGLALVLTTPFFLVGALGGGDVKLLAAVGAFMGWRQLVGACLIIGLLGGVIALLDAIRRGILPSVLASTLHLILRWIWPVRSQESTSAMPTTPMTLPYGVAISVGALAWWFWGGRMV